VAGSGDDAGGDAEGARVEFGGRLRPPAVWRSFPLALGGRVPARDVDLAVAIVAREFHVAGFHFDRPAVLVHAAVEAEHGCCAAASPRLIPFAYYFVFLSC